MSAVKALAYAAVAYTIGHEILSVAGGIADPTPIADQPVESWKAFFEDVKSSPALKIGVQFVALAYLGQDFIEASRGPELRSEKLEVFGSPMVKNAAVGAVATLVGAQIATAALTVGPFYAPLVTDGIDAFISSLPTTPEARQAVLHDVESPFSLHAIAVFTAYRYVRHDFVPEALRGALTGLKSLGAALVRDRSSGFDLGEVRRRLEAHDPQQGGQSDVEKTDFNPSPMR